MKGFFKSLLASIIGCAIVFGVFLLIVGGIISVSLGMLASDSSKPYVLKDNSVLYINLTGELVDRVEKNELMDLLNISIMGQEDVGKISLIDLMSAIKKAEKESSIKGIYIRVGATMGGSASFNELRKALLDFKEKSDKFIIAYGDIYTQNGYYVASVADKVFMNPEGVLDVHGYASSPLFYKKLLDNLGVKVQVFKVGTYKSAVEPYIDTQMSPANREQMEVLLEDMWSIYADGIQKNRGLPYDTINYVANDGIFMQVPQFSINYKLVDSLKYETEVNTYIKSLVNLSEKDKLILTTPDNMNNIEDKDKKSEKTEKNIIAIVYAEGEISAGNSKQGITDGNYVKILNKLKNNDDVKAVVFRVNSPGGSAFASEQIWKAVTDLKAVKPIVVSMGDYAASGGYYISCNASKIFAQPNTITGSIGIFGLFPDIQGLTNKIGIGTDFVKTNTFADQGNIMRPMSEQEKKLVQNYVERGYELFITRCANGRQMTKEEINKIGQGRVWTGQQAIKLGLVDELGGIDEAIVEAAKLGNVKKYNTKDYPVVETFMESLLSAKKEDLIKQTLREYLGASYSEFNVISKLKNTDPIQARIPFMID